MRTFASARDKVYYVQIEQHGKYVFVYIKSISSRYKKLTREFFNFVVISVFIDVSCFLLLYVIPHFENGNMYPAYIEIHY